MAANAQYASTIQTATVTIATTNITDRAVADSTKLVDIFTAGASGSRIDDIRFHAKGTTSAAVMLLLFVSSGAAANAVIVREINISAITPSATVQAWNAEISDWGLCLESGYKLHGCVTADPGIAIAVTVTRAGDL